MIEQVGKTGGTNLLEKGLAVAAILFLLLGTAGLLGRSDWNPLVTTSEAASENIATSSIAVYVSLRVINSALSTAQEVEIGASVVGQASLQPLKVIEPVDDTVERVAEFIFLLATVAALTTAGLSPLVSVGLITLGSGLLCRLCLGRWPSLSEQMRPVYNKAISLGLSVGILLPLSFTLGVWMGEVATTAQLDTASNELNSIADKARYLIGATDDEDIGDPQNDDEDSGLLIWLRNQASKAHDGVANVFERSNRYLEAAQVFIDEADTLLKASLTIISVFLLRVLVLPVFLLWGIASLFGAALRRTAKE